MIDGMNSVRLFPTPTVDTIVAPLVQPLVEFEGYAIPSKCFKSDGVTKLFALPTDECPLNRNALRTRAVSDDSRAVVIATVGHVSKSCLVRVAKSAPPAPKYVLTALTNGAVLSGDVTAWAETNSRDIQYGDVYFSVDREAGETGNLGSLSGSHLAYGRDFSIGTEEYRNGPHTVSLYDDSGETDRRIVTFQNAISEVKCDLDLHAGSVAHIRATLQAPENWTVTIRDEQERIVRKIAGNSATIDTSWDAKNDAGTFVLRGAYTFVVRAGSHKSEPRTIEFY